MKKLFTILFTIVVCCEMAFSQQGPTSIITGTLVYKSPKISDMIVPEKPKAKDTDGREFGENDKANKKARFSINNPSAKSVDASVQTTAAQPSGINPTLPLITTFDGVVSADNVTLYGSTFAPPDPVMSVGPNHVVMMANSAHKIYNKAGTLLTGPLKFSAIAPGAGDDGDPIALYDQVADRWLLLQFDLPAGNEALIFCISQTGDPTGAYNVYRFPTPGVFPDYPHIGIWNNSYVITTHEFNLAGTAYLGQGYYAVDRNKMVEGTPTTTLIRFQDVNEGGYLPVSFEGSKTPDPSSQPLFITFDADEFTGGVDQLKLRTLTPNFVTPASSTLSAATLLPTSAFDGRSPAVRSAIEQSGTADGLDAIADRMMSRIIYRRFDNSESLVMNYAVNVSGVNPTNTATYQAAMRWYELSRPTPASAWTINQQSTYSPTGTGNGATGDNRWMGCTGIDQRGNIAMGYSKSSSTTFPSIFYAERKKSDALNTLSADQLFHASTGSQTGSSNRWGDYTAMATDPTDEETLWYTDEYYSATGAFNFKTRIGSFKINDPLTIAAVHFRLGGTISRQKEALGTFKDYPIFIDIDNAPSQNVNVTLTKTGTATEGVDYDLLNTSGIVLNGANLSKQFTLRVYDNAVGEPDEFIDIAYTLNFNTGNGVAGNYNQKHRVTIIGTTNCPSIPVITVTRPATFCQGDSAILDVPVIAGITYQWLKGGVNIGGATQPQLIVKTAGVYTVNATRGVCTIPSGTGVTIVVNPVVVPTVGTYNVCQNAAVPSGQGLVVPSTITNTVSGALVSGTTYVRGLGNNTTTYTASRAVFFQTFTFVAPSSAAVTFATTAAALTPGDADDTYLTLYQTTFTPGTPAVNFLRGDDDSGPGFLSSLTHTLTAGNVYVLVVSSFSTGATGTFTLQASATNSADALGFGGNNNWFLAATGGSSLFTGNIFNPVGVAGSGIANTATPGAYPFYVSNSTYPTCRTLTTFNIVSTTAPTVGTITQPSCVTPTGSVVLSGLPSTGTWTINPGSITGTGTSTTITGLAAGATYNFTVTSATCVSTASANVVINAVPSPPTGILVGSNSPVTVGNPINLTSSSTGGTSQSWTGPNVFTSAAQNPIIASATLAMAGVYTVTITSSGTCIATATTNVVVNAAPTSCITPTATAISNSPICAGTALNLAATCTGSISATLNGTSEVPANASTATGSVTGIFDPVMNLLTVNVTFNGLSAAATAAHIHNAAAGVNGPVIIAFPGFPSAVSGTYSNSFTLTAPQATALASGGLYVNIHNATFPGGEIRGQIALSTCTFAWTGVNGFNSTAQNPSIPSATTAATGTYQVIVTNAGCTAMATTSATVNAVPTGATAGSNSPVTVGGTINLTSSSTGGTSQTWGGPSGFTSTAQNPSIASATSGMAGVYTVTITSSGTCTATATTSVVVNPAPTNTVVFVNIANAAAPTQNGISWATAFGNLQTALAAGPANAEIWVAQGIYKPTITTNQNISFNIPSGAMLFGGFVGTEVTQNQRNFNTNLTILSGEIGSVGTVSDNSYHVVTFIGANNATILDGFTVMAGNANLTAERVRPVPPPPGQPLSINDGGGIGLDNASSPMIVNCKIISNDGINGGGLFATNGSNPTIMNSMFRNNQATFGGATYHLGSNPVYKNVLMSGNKATGGAMYNNGSNPMITNATIAGNGGLNGAVFNSSSTPVIKNSILWGNVTPFNDVQSIISYSIVEGGYPGVGNLNLNPQFVNLFPHGLAPTLSGDYKLTSTSPAIDAGDNGTIGLTDKDLEGNLRRFNGGLVDIGAYEFQGSRIGGTVISIVSGNWEMGTTWDIGRKPLAGDIVIINNNHIVTVNENGVLKNIELKSNAKVMYSTAGLKLQTGF